eukprot:5486184-Prymnesium_polylepis.1
MAESEPEELELEAGMKLAEIDLTGDVPIETATFDGGGVIPQQVELQFESYQLPLHLRLPPGI